MKELSLHILDIAMNSVRADSKTIDIYISVDNAKDLLNIKIDDNGCGMDKEMLEQVLDPFTTTRTTRKVGLGIPLFKANTELCNGSFDITSQKNIGTEVTAIYQLNNIDRPILGDISKVMTMLFSSHPDIEFSFSYTNDGTKFAITTSEIKEELDGISIQEPEVKPMLEEIINSQLNEIGVIE